MRQDARAIVARVCAGALRRVRGLAHKMITENLRAALAVWGPVVAQHAPPPPKPLLAPRHVTLPPHASFLPFAIRIGADGLTERTDTIITSVALVGTVGVSVGGTRVTRVLRREAPVAGHSSGSRSSGVARLLPLLKGSGLRTLSIYLNELKVRISPRSPLDLPSISPPRLDYLNELKA